MTLPTPPKYVVLPQEAIEQAYAPDKPRRALLASFTRILSLAWESKYQKTPPMNEQELMEFLKLSRRQYFEQKADMELLGWLRSSHPVPGFVQFTFSRAITLSDPTQATGAEKRTASAEKRTDIKELGGGGESLDLIQDSIPPLKEKGGAENRTYPSVVEILRHTDLLFDGSLVISKGLEGRLPVHVLCWCAYAYSQKEKLAAPGGVVRNRLKEDEPPPEWTKHRWYEVLPENFLEALGLIEYECELCPATFKTRAELDAHEATHPPAKEQPDPEVAEIDPSVHEVIPGQSITPAQAWGKVLERLKEEMPRANFDTWVRDTVPVRFGGNGSGPVLSIGARNVYARDWLESRLTDTVNRILVAALDSQVMVQFVVSQVEVEHG